MFRWALAFFLIAVVAGIFGFTGIAVGASSVAKIVFGAALALGVIGAVIALVRRNPPHRDGGRPDV